MNKIKKNSFICASCSYMSVKWLGCCPECAQWDSFVEQKPSLPRSRTSPTKTGELSLLDSIELAPQSRIFSGIAEWDRVVGGGIMPGSFMIITGDPGVGKSTLLLQLSSSLAQKNKLFYFSTEESLSQIKLRAQRLGCASNGAFFSDEAHLEAIIDITRQEKPSLIIIDSIQNCFLTNSDNVPGSIAHLREAAFLLMRLAKENTITVLITGHITKEGVIAGPKTLEHMVDTVLYLQGEDRWQIRVLRAVKNRFGTINELGFFEMQSQGLSELGNINEYLVSSISHSPGSALISYLEGSRPLLLELQALTIASRLTLPQRVIAGIDHTQVVLIAAILEKYLHIKLSTHDIFFKVSSGFKLKGSTLDLGIALALLSSYFQQALPQKSLAFGEIGLTGHIKPINHSGQFVKEAQQFGLSLLFVARNQKVDSSSITVCRFEHIYELLTLFDKAPAKTEPASHHSSSSC